MLFLRVASMLIVLFWLIIAIFVIPFRVVDTKAPPQLSYFLEETYPDVLSVYVYDVNADESRHLFTPTNVQSDRFVNNVKWNPDGHYLQITYLGDRYNTAPTDFWLDSETRHMISIPEFRKWGLSVSPPYMAPDESTIWGVGNEFIVQYRNSDIKRNFPDFGPIYDASWSPDSTHLIVAHANGILDAHFVSVLNTTTQELVPIVENSKSHLAAWSPTGKQIATVSSVPLNEIIVDCFNILSFETLEKTKIICDTELSRVNAPEMNLPSRNLEHIMQLYWVERDTLTYIAKTSPVSYEIRMYDFETDQFHVLHKQVFLSPAGIINVSLNWAPTHDWVVVHDQFSFRRSVECIQKRG
ncbi:MAG: hypothetical protein AAF787_08210, partial [Chloroflexota bacterium]